MTIEKLKQEDIAELLELYKGLGEFEMSLEASKNTYMGMINDESYLLLIAKEDNKIIGSVLGIICKSLLVRGKPFMVVEDVIVDEQYRRKGVGKKLFEKLDEFAKEKLCDYSILVSSGFRHNAHIFYENIGYTEDVRGFRKIY